MAAAAGSACAGIDISGNPDDFYNGCYSDAGEWSGAPHMMNDNGAHLYWLDGEGYGYWQLDNREQDGTNDWFDGGYMYVEGEWYETPDTYDETGFATYTFTVGDLGFQVGAGGCEDAFTVTHPSNGLYDGFWWRAEDWGEAPHFTNADGMHLYFLDYEGYGYWQLDNTDQSGADGLSDLYDGGYLYCEGEWYDCSPVYDDAGYGSAEFTTGTVGF